MVNYDVLLNRLQVALRDNIVCEDGEIHLKCKLKYDVFNILVEEDSEFIKKLYEELEYRE